MEIGIQSVPPSNKFIYKLLVLSEWLKNVTNRLDTKYIVELVSNQLFKFRCIYAVDIYTCIVIFIIWRQMRRLVTDLF